MAEKSLVSAIPFSAGIRRSRGADPFFMREGEVTQAQCGVYTEEGGFLQHGGTVAVLSAVLADGGYPVWSKRWFRGPLATNPVLILSSNGTLYWAATDPSATSVSLSVAQDFTSGSGVNITGLSSTYFTVAEHSGWLYLCPNDTSDPFYRFNGTEFFQVGAIKPLSAPVLAATSGNLANGTYVVAYTYVYGTDEELGESNASPGQSIVIAAAPQGINVTVTPSGRSDVSAIRIYRTLAGGSIPYFVKEVTNTAGPHALTAADSELSFANYELEGDHDLPPMGRRSIVAWKERIFLIVDQPRNRIHLSIAGQPDVFPPATSAGFTSDELNHQSPAALTTLFTLGERIYATSETGIWVLSGDTNENFFWERLQSDEGYIAERSVVTGRGLAFGVGSSDIIIFDGVRPVAHSKIRGLLADVGALVIDESIGTFRKGFYYVAVKRGTGYDRIVLLDARSVPGVERFAASTFETSYRPDKDDPSSSATFEVTDLSSWNEEGERIFVGRLDGQLYEFDRGRSVGLAAEDSAGMEYLLKTGWFFPGGPHTFDVYEKVWAAIEDDGAGGEVELSWELMTDDLNELRTGSATISLHPVGTDIGQSIFVWNFSRWG